MTALISVEAVAIVLLAVLVAGLLRSHADILRALHQLGVDPTATGRGIDGGSAGHGSQPAVARAAAGGAADLAGVTPRGSSVVVAVTATQHDTLLAFLTSGCSTCVAFWSQFAQPDLAVPGNARLVIVAHDPSEESPSRIWALAPPGLAVVMSSQAWADYGVEVAPYFVYVSGPSGRVAGEGAASTWAEISSLLGQALADATLEGEAARPAARRRSTDQAREARADAELQAAGIRPGDPRLYPSRLDDPTTGTR